VTPPTFQKGAIVGSGRTENERIGLDETGADSYFRSDLTSQGGSSPNLMATRPFACRCRIQHRLPKRHSGLLLSRSIPEDREL